MVIDCLGLECFRCSGAKTYDAHATRVLTCRKNSMCITTCNGFHRDMTIHQHRYFLRSTLIVGISRTKLAP